MLTLKQFEKGIDSGLTLNIKNGTEFIADTGYMVSLYGHEETHSVYSLTIDDIRTYIFANFYPLRKSRHFFGMWRNLDKVYLDVSVYVPTFEDAVRLGRENNQLAIFDLANKTEIKL